MAGYSDGRSPLSDLFAYADAQDAAAQPPSGTDSGSTEDGYAVGAGFDPSGGWGDMIRRPTPTPQWLDDAVIRYGQTGLPSLRIGDGSFSPLAQIAGSATNSIPARNESAAADLGLRPEFGLPSPASTAGLRPTLGTTPPAAAGMAAAPPPSTGSRQDPVLGFESGIFRPWDNAAIWLEGLAGKAGLPTGAIDKVVGMPSAEAAADAHAASIEAKGRQGIVPSGAGQFLGGVVAGAPLVLADPLAGLIAGEALNSDRNSPEGKFLDSLFGTSPKQKPSR